MAVYVDPIMTCLPNPRWKWDKSCHLIADSLDELHGFAKRLGLRYEWFQRDKANGGSSTLPHYDLTVGKRAEAVRIGAIELTREQMVERIRAARPGLIERLDAVVGEAPAPAQPGLFGDAPADARGRML